MLKPHDIKIGAKWHTAGKARDYVTTVAIEWRIGKKGSDWLFIVPMGKEFESSVPSALRWLWSPDDPQYLLPARVHDTLLEAGYRIAFADSQWFDGAMAMDAPKLKTHIAYNAMRLRRLWHLIIGKGRGNAC